MARDKLVEEGKLTPAEAEEAADEWETVRVVGGSLLLGKEFCLCFCYVMFGTGIPKENEYSMAGNESCRAKKYMKCFNERYLQSTATAMMERVFITRC